SNRVLVLASLEHSVAAHRMAYDRLKDKAKVAVVTVRDDPPQYAVTQGLVGHSLRADDPTLAGLIEQADALVVYPDALHIPALAHSNAPKAIIGTPAGLKYAI